MERRESFVTRWDLDKTYLRSRFSTVSDLVSSALERAEEKRAIPGATAVLRELWAAGARVHILSGSPRQMRRKLETKLRLDGVSWDELTLKPNLSNVMRLRLRALRDQLGYKLPELLAARAREQARSVTQEDVREVLVGDDSESDAFVYSLYADICAGTVDARELERVLEAGRAYPSAFRSCQRALSTIPIAPVVDRILIHLDGQTPPSQFARYGERLVPFYNYLQAAFLLLERGMLSAPAALRIASEFIARHGFSGDTVARSYTDLLRRGHADGSASCTLERALAVPDETGGGRADAELRLALAHMSESPAPVRASRPAHRTDYVDLASHHQSGKNRRRPGQRFG
jgi:hypothetical protein